MEKQTYFKDLRKALRWTFGKEETADILSDYEGFFATGAAEGKSEAKICAELGDPEEIALNLAETLGKKRRFSAKVRGRMISAVVLFCLGLLYFGMGIDRESAVMNSIALLPVTAALWFVLGGLPPVSRLKKRFGGWLVLGGHVLMGGMTASSVVWFWSFSDKLPGERAGVALTLERGWIAFAAAALLIAVLAVAGFYRLTPQAFTLAVHALGAVVYLGMVYAVFGNLSDPAAFNSDMREALGIYTFAVLLTGVCALLIHTVKRRVR